jgi:hypothetical protein
MMRTTVALLGAALVTATTAVAVITAGSAGAVGPALAVAGVSASGDDGNVPANAIDGNYSTRWSDEGDGVWLRLDLGANKDLGAVAIAWHNGTDRRADFLVQTSDAATPSTWTSAVSRRLANGTTSQLETYDFTDRNDRYLRVVGYGNEDNNWTSILEIVVYGADSAGPSPTSSPTSPPSGCTYPADRLNLTNWELTLPTGPSENPDDIYQPALRTFTVDPWFKVNSSCTGVQFRAAVNGVTTSGSSYPRSELREMKNNGADKAAWSSGSGTHTMVVSEAITHLPSTKPHVVAGQIHDSADDTQVFRLEGSSLWLTNGDNAHYKLITSSYQLGTRFEAKFVVSSNTIRAYYNGVLQSTLSKSFSGAYFKAGAYTQANCSNSSPCSTSNYGEVIVYSLSVTHS